MPFMKGRAPVRRTLKYLESGRLIFRPEVRIMTVSYNVHGENHQGTKEFVFWFLPQIQYRNPGVQILTFKHKTPNPYLRFFLDEGEEVLMDTDNKTREDIYSHLRRILCKSDAVLAAEAKMLEQRENPANFGPTCPRHCICELPGQVPCPAIVPLPKFMRGKYRYGLAQDES